MKDEAKQEGRGGLALMLLPLIVTVLNVLVTSSIPGVNFPKQWYRSEALPFIGNLRTMVLIIRSVLVLATRCLTFAGVILLLGKVTWRGRAIEPWDEMCHPASYTEGRVKIMRNAGLRVAHSVYAGEDHWMLFRSTDRVIDEIVRWIGRNIRE